MMSPADPFIVTAAAAAAALSAALIAAVVGHGVLRPLLEARGIAPWTLRDSVGSLLLVLIGSALVAGAAVAAATAAVLSAPLGAGRGVLCLALLLAGALMMRLGLLALRKLT